METRILGALVNAVSSTEPEVAVRYRGVEKSYGATKALKGVDLDFHRGRIHALVGENGAGKSTALGILAGRVKPTAGSVELDGNEIPYGAPRALRAAGVGSVYQELTIAPMLTVEANLFLGQSVSRFGLLRESEMRDRYRQVCDEVGIEPKRPGTLAGRLSVADQQMIEIMRLLVSECQVILLDEPTASLANNEREAVFGVLRTLRERGIAIVVVSHNLDEVMDLADTVTVFREGYCVRSAAVTHWTKTTMVNAMLGQQVDKRLREEWLSDPSTNLLPSDDDAPGHGRELKHTHVDRLPVLKVSGLTVPGAIDEVSLEVQPGEILGLAGLVGSGRSTVLRALYGLEPTASGRVWVDGEPVRLPKTVRGARKLGLALLPEDRKSQGLVMGMAAMENIVLADLRSATRHGVLSARSVRRASAGAARQVRFEEGRLSTLAINLSGGNQQKLLVARWLYAKPRVLLVDEPSRGVDIGARSEILRSLEDAAATGVSVVMISSELEELTAICHRVVVLSAGRVAGELSRTEKPLHVSDILHIAFGTETEN